MRRSIQLSCLIACVGAMSGVAAAATAPQVARAPLPRAHLRGFVCTRALEPAQRLVSVTAVMRPLKGTKGLELQFNLLARAPRTTAWGSVHGGDLGMWITPPKHVSAPLGTRAGDVWTLNHPVADLPAPATYRFHVLFRWRGAHGRTLATVALNSHTCFEPELRPDLVALSFTAQPIPNHPKHNQYTFSIKDSGLTGAGPFQVEFTGNGFVAPNNVMTIQYIGAHQTLTRTFRGPVCEPSAPPTMTIDPTQQVNMYTRVNTTLAATCPPVPAPPAG